MRDRPRSDRVDQALALGDADDDEDVVYFCGFADGIEMSGGDIDGFSEIAGVDGFLVSIFKTGIGDLIDPEGIAGQERFSECDELGTGGCGFGY